MKQACSLLLGLAVLTFSSPACTEEVESVVTLLEFVIDVDAETAAKCLQTLTKQVQSGELHGERLGTIRDQLDDKLSQVLKAGPQGSLFWDVTLLAASWRSDEARTIARRVAVASHERMERRIAALDALAAAQDELLLAEAGRLLHESDPLAGHLLAALGAYEQASVAGMVLSAYAKLPQEQRPKAIELLTQRATWSKALLEAISRGEVDRSALNVNHLRKLLSSRDAELVELVRKEWGEVRAERNPQREQVLAEMRDLLARSQGNPQRGRQVFERVCGQCHKIHGQGQDVGPEITRNGRGNYEQLLSNIFDPSLVIGAAYQARTVITVDGRVLTGLVAEDNDQRVVLKTQGGKLEVIPRNEVDEMAVSQLSLMPEGLEKQVAPQELADLVAFLVLDLPPDDENTTAISGTPAGLLERQ